jgi:hypothetical protein
VAVGITADSFIVYFERLRDEVRDGRTLRSSVEAGWVRARSTILARTRSPCWLRVVLFIFAIGVVKGFAFALGLTTHSSTSSSCSSSPSHGHAAVAHHVLRPRTQVVRSGPAASGHARRWLEPGTPRPVGGDA